MKNGTSIIPTMRYLDAPAAIEWLCKAFGFEQHLVVPGENNQIMHAQLVLGDAMIMLGSDRDNEFGQLIRRPGQVGGFNTQSPYVIVPEVDALYQRAKAAGAEIVYDIRDEAYGGRGFSCKDPEGYLWNFGSYNPWK